jgi:hypothetical protein
VAWAALAWYELYPHSVSVRELCEHPTRYSGRMVRLDGMLCTTGDRHYFGLTQAVLNDAEIPIGASIGSRFLASDFSRRALGDLMLAGQRDRRRARKGVVRYVQVPAVIVGWLTYYPKACFSSGLEVQVFHLSIHNTNLAVNATSLEQMAARRAK